jgi:iron complex outermembrane recepter protein
MKYFYLAIILLFLSFKINAQQTQVIFKITSRQNQAVPSATVQLISAADTTKSISAITDTLGQATISLTQGQYRLTISAVGFKEVEKGILISANSPTLKYVLEANSKNLQEVRVTATRPLMRQEDDKTIVDPENLAASSTNAYEIIEKTPGIFVDQDGNIYLNSTTPALIYINGREQKMSTADVATMLKSLPPNSIASIEIMRTPSARYDASGGGGVVNVILKKGVKIGLTGSVTAGGNQGSYGNQFIGLNLNNSNGKTSTYINIQYNRRVNSEEIKTDRIFAPDSLLRQDAFTVYRTNNYFAGVGLNFQLSKKLEIGYDGRISFSDSRNTTENTSTIIKRSSNNIITSNLADVKNNASNTFQSHGISGKYKIDSAGSELTADISYNNSPGVTDQLIRTIFYVPFNATGLGDGLIDTRLNFFSSQANLALKFPKQLNLEAGVKSTSVSFNNSTDYFRGSGSSRIKDNVRTSSYKYDETINAAYLQLSKTVSGITLKAGTRLEQTLMKGRQFIPTDTSFSINRTDAFPYVYLSRNLMKVAGYDLRAYLVHRRTINRPGYQLLNPSQRFIDPYLFETGNPALKPQFTKNYEFNISVDERPVFAIGFNDTKDIFTNVVYQADTARSVAYRTYDNLGKNKETYFRALGAIPPGGRYFFVAGFTYIYNHYEGSYEGKPLEFKRGSWSIFTYQTFKLTPTTQLVLNGFARFKGQLQFYELSGFGALNFSITQQMLKKKLTATLSVNDAFFTNNNEFTLKQGSVEASGYRQADTRRIGLNLRYNFGFRKKEDNHNMFNVESPERAN